MKNNLNKKKQKNEGKTGKKIKFLIEGWNWKQKKLQQKCKETCFLLYIKIELKWKTKHTRNSNWRTKLNKKNYIKGIRTK